MSWEDTRSEVIAEIDRRIDQFYGDYKAFDPKVYELLAEREFNQRQATILLRHYTPTLLEIKDVILKKDPELEEAYHRLTSDQRMNYFTFLGAICEDLARYSMNNKKPRAKRERAVSVILKHFEYKKQDAALKLVSVAPEGILGAKAVVLYNTKYHKITLLAAKDSNGLSIHRMAIINYDEAKSVTKVSRKLNVSAFTNGTFAFTEKLMNGIKNKPSTLANRVGSDTLILRIFR